MKTRGRNDRKRARKSGVRKRSYLEDAQRSFFGETSISKMRKLWELRECHESFSNESARMLDLFSG